MGNSELEINGNDMALICYLFHSSHYIMLSCEENFILVLELQYFEAGSQFCLLLLLYTLLKVSSTQTRHSISRLLYRAEKKSWYVVARNFFLLLLNFSARPCMGAA